MAVKYILILGLALAYALIEGSFVAREEAIVQEARDKADAHRAQLFAGLLAACFNGQYLTDGERTIHCKVKK